MSRFSDLFSDYIDNDILADIGSGEIYSFVVSRDKRTLSIGLYLDCFVSYDKILRAEKSLKKSIVLNKVTIEPVFPKSEFSLGNIERILEYAKRETPAANGFFDGAEAEIEDNTLTVFLKKGGKDVLLAQKVDSVISSVLYKLFKVDYDVSFLEVQSFDIEKAVKEAVEEKHRQEEIKKVEEEKNVVHEQWGELPLYKDTVKNIYGKTLRDTPTPIKDVTTEDGYITVWGDVFESEVRDTKRGTNRIFNFNITDYTSSITVKMFEDRRVIDQIGRAHV